MKINITKANLRVVIETMLFDLSLVVDSPADYNERSRIIESLEDQLRLNRGKEDTSSDDVHPCGLFK